MKRYVYLSLFFLTVISCFNVSNSMLKFGLSNISGPMIASDRRVGFILLAAFFLIAYFVEVILDRIYPVKKNSNTVKESESN